MECVCEKINEVPKYAIKIGEFKNGDPIYGCFDARKTDCKHYIDYNETRGHLMICGYMTNCSKNNPD